MHDTMKVVIVGLGYIGLPTAALIAAKGITVHGVDVNTDVVSTINRSVSLSQPLLPWDLIF